MKTLFLDLSNGVSGDMVLGALTDLTEDPENTGKTIDEISSKIDEITEEKGAGHDHHHGDGHDHAHFHRSYSRVLEIIEALGLDPQVEKTARNIYEVIAGAESKVHGSPLDDLHFHEVGRNRAIANIAGVALCIGQIGAENIVYTEICDGTGTVECAHGTLSVPVPAVKAMLDRYDVNYRQTEYDGEMVTPSGLAMIIGIGAEAGDMPEGEPAKCAEATGARSVDGKGLKACIFQG